MELVAAVEQIEVVAAVAAASVEGHVEIHHRRYQVAAASFHVGLLAVAAAACCLVVVEILYRLLLLGVVALDSRSLYCKTPPTVTLFAMLCRDFETATPHSRAPRAIRRDERMSRAKIQNLIRKDWSHFISRS